MPGLWPLSLVLDFHEVKAAGWGGGAAQTSVAGFKEVFDVLWRHLSATDFKQCADDVPHHVVKKTFRLDLVDQFVAALIQMRGRALPVGCFDLAL